jgi:hypothetical protein
LGGRLSKLAIAVGLTNLGGVLPTGFAVAIPHQASGISNADLLCQGGGYRRRHLAWIAEKGAEEPHRAELHGEAEAHVLPPATAD